VEDDQIPGPDQCRRSAFLHALVTATQADTEVAEDCPLSRFWLEFYGCQPAARIERACYKFAPQIIAFDHPMEWIPILRARLREGMRRASASGHDKGS
jgi:hypothetical protein